MTISLFLDILVIEVSDTVKNNADALIYHRVYLCWEHPQISPDRCLERKRSQNGDYYDSSTPLYGTIENIP